MKNIVNGFPMEFVRAASVLGRYDNTDAEAKLLSKIISSATHPRILDVCCGFGRISGKLHALGFNVTGIDLSEEQISLAKTKNSGSQYLLQDMRTPPMGEFDALINMFTSFGYLEKETDDIQMLKTWSNCLRRDGILVMELADMDRARARLPRDKARFIRKTKNLEEHCFMDWDRRIFQVTYSQDVTEFTCWTRLYEKEDLRDHLLDAGFREVNIFGDLALRAKQPDDNLVIVATK